MIILCAELWVIFFPACVWERAFLSDQATERSQKWTTCKSALCVAESWFGNRLTFHDCSLFPIFPLGAGTALKKSISEVLNHFWGVLCSPPACSQQPAEHRSWSFHSSFFLLLHRDSPAEPCDGTPVLDAGHLALRPTRRWHLPHNEALPVPGGSAHLSRGTAHAQLLVSQGVCLAWQQLLDWSSHGFVSLVSFPMAKYRNFHPNSPKYRNFHHNFHLVFKTRWCCGVWLHGLTLIFLEYLWLICITSANFSGPWRVVLDD